MRLKYLLLIVISICYCSSVYAVHIKGGWIYYEYLGKGINDTSKSLYRISLKVYRDCNVPNPGQNDDPMQLTVYEGNSTTPYSTLNIPLNRVDTMDKKYYSPCFTTHPSLCYRILVYTQTVELPKNSSGYVLSYQRCCRIAGLANVASPSSDIGNTYSTTIPGTAIDPGFVQNNSPVFAQKDTVLICYNSYFSLDFSAADIDGDSLVYYYSNALGGGSTAQPIPSPSQTLSQISAIPYSSGYSGTNPFGTSTSINTTTGIIDGTAPMPGEYVLSVSVDEYRHGIKIGTTRKELHVIVGNCALSAAALPASYTSCKGNPVSFQNQTSSPNIVGYHWDFGVKNSSTDTSTKPTPAFIYPDTGIYKINLVVDGAGGCQDSAFSVVTVYPKDAPIVKIITSTNPAFNDEQVSFTANVLNGFSKSSFLWYKNNIQVGTDSAVYVDSVMNNGDSIWCMYSGHNPCITIEATYSDTIKMKVNQGLYISGNAISPKGFIIPNTYVNITGATNTNFLSTGNYQYELSIGLDYLLKLSKNNDVNKSNGVSALDLAITQAHILNKSLLNSPYKIIAADVNGDGKISALDLVYMKRLILGIDTTFTNTITKQNSLWTFVDSSFKFADSTNPFPYKDSISYIGLNAIQTNQTFIGIKLGDVNWDWNPSLAKLPSPMFVRPKKMKGSH